MEWWWSFKVFSNVNYCSVFEVIATVRHLASTSPGNDSAWFSFLQLTGLSHLLYVFAPVVSSPSMNAALDNSGNESPLKSPLHCCRKRLWYYCNSFCCCCLFFWVSLPICKTEMTVFLTSRGSTGVKQFPQAFCSIVWGCDLLFI